MNTPENTPNDRPTTEQIAVTSAGAVQEAPDRPAAGSPGQAPGAGPQGQADPAAPPPVQSQPGNAGPAAGNRAGQITDSPVHGETGAMTAGAGSAEPDGPPRTRLVDDDELQSISTRWREIQAAFVDDPRTAVQEADTLVAEFMQRLAAMFARERADLEQRWADGNQVSTEELRQNLRRYRSFFERLLEA